MFETTGVTPLTGNKLRCVTSSNVIPKIGAHGRNLAKRRTVFPLCVNAIIQFYSA